jgi:hypothetical protein
MVLQQQVDKAVEDISELDDGVVQQLRQLGKDRNTAFAEQQWDAAEEAEEALDRLLDSAVDKKSDAINTAMHTLVDLRSKYVISRMAEAPG